MVETETTNDVGIAPVGLERTGGIDDDVRRCTEECLRIGANIKCQVLAAQLFGKRSCFTWASSCDHDVMAVPDEKFGEPGAKHAVAAKDDDPHSMSLARSAGSGMLHKSMRPKSQYRLRASLR